ncbi:hypothetical protein ACFL56_03035 [Candidatus Margulisiibacteriota bacterium]
MYKKGVFIMDISPISGRINDSFRSDEHFEDLTGDVCDYDGFRIIDTGDENTTEFAIRFKNRQNEIIEIIFSDYSYEIPSFDGRVEIVHDLTYSVYEYGNEEIYNNNYGKISSGYYLTENSDACYDYHANHDYYDMVASVAEYLEFLNIQNGQASQAYNALLDELSRSQPYLSRSNNNLYFRSEDGLINTRRVIETEEGMYICEENNRDVISDTYEYFFPGVINIDGDVYYIAFDGHNSHLLSVETGQGVEGLEINSYDDFSYPPCWREHLFEYEGEICARIRNRDNEWAYVSINSGEVVSDWYSYIDDHGIGGPYVIVRNFDGQYGLLSRNDGVIISPWFDEIDEYCVLFKDCICVFVRDADRGWALFSMENRDIISDWFFSIDRSVFGVIQVTLEENGPSYILDMETGELEASEE